MPAVWARRNKVILAWIGVRTYSYAELRGTANTVIILVSQDQVFNKSGFLSVKRSPTPYFICFFIKIQLALIGEEFKVLSACVLIVIESAQNVLKLSPKRCDINIRFASLETHLRRPRLQLFCQLWKHFQHKWMSASPCCSESVI